jgi:hypothetical protein
MLAQITTKKVQDVLTQITRDNFFYESTRTNKMCVLAQITINKVQYVLAQITRDNFFYERTRTKMRCVLAQIKINKACGHLVVNVNVKLFVHPIPAYSTVPRTQSNINFRVFG